MSRTRSSGLVIAVCAASRIAAADPLAVHASGELPFSVGELEAALALRAQLATAHSATRLDAEVSGEAGGVAIAAAGRSRRIALDGEHGADAARLVAFAILDLAGDQLDPPDAVVATAPTPGRTWSAALWGAIGTRREATLELGVGLAGELRAIGGAGIALDAELHGAGEAVDLHAYPIRLGLAWRRGWFEARATGLAVLERAAAQRTTTDALFGGGLALVVAPLRAGGVAILAGGGADAFTSTIEYRVHGEHVATTERIAWWAGLAIAYEVTR